MHSELVLSQAHTDNDNTMLLPSESLVHCGGITTAEVEASQATQPSPGPSWEHSYSSHTQLSRDSFNSGLIQLCHLFPNRSEESLRYIYELSNGDLSSAADLILSGPSLENLLSCIRSALVDGEFNECLLKIGEDEQEGEDLVNCLFAFYKKQRYDPHKSLCVCFRGQPAVDTGGVRQQVFSPSFSYHCFFR